MLRSGRGYTLEHDRYMNAWKPMTHGKADHSAVWCSDVMFSCMKYLTKSEIFLKIKISVLMQIFNNITF